MSIIKHYQCPNCNAPFDVDPENKIFNCINCGQAILADGSAFKNHRILRNTLSLNEVHIILKDFIKKKGFLRGIGNYSLTKTDLLLIPFWVVLAHAFTSFLGYRRYTESRTVGSGKNRRTEQVTVYKEVKGKIDERRTEPILGRRTTTLFGYDQLIRYVRRDFNKAEPFNQEILRKKVNSFNYLASEISLDYANQLAKTEIFEDHRKKAENRCTKVFDCSSQVTYKGTVFMHVPVWQIQYSHKKETYRLTLLGHTGEIVKGELPVTPRYRIAMLSITLLSLIGGGTITYFFFLPYIFGAIVSAVIVSVLGFFTINNLFKEKSVVS